ncbi:hypothetical protein TVAG_477760 [Trichomonas vaginalis G3]|uniref:Uncharacterized protein n=1 Tax=Trichomonas vaginalis (strain ATCC PRA-98 / G3) TaxID=412133 RepID=A2G250_TRIV3|nr:hypothetical protein TVAGG3_0375000 [Trichomonas vaginalis G3]EAX88773.1 hypothetical protein TVAG_477760 [Trichomonas vaginalis G3]KAI5532879.1 hypothetical protein TVAGG3_0375000 [Trichomonas vaginalis G3]|eukprot:XP_001301703.1 hypothetical protein [Trichomonas vaginalis G3]
MKITISVLDIGNPQSGKAGLALHYARGTYNENDQVPPDGKLNRQVTFDGNYVDMEIYDPPGQNDFSDA